MKKKVLIISLIVLAALSIVFVARQNNKNKWYVEITNEFINIRADHNIYGARLGEVKKGETYKVLDIYTEDDNYYWYYIEINRYKKGWIASDKDNPYLNDFNNPNDIVAPVVKYYEEIYYTHSIDTITYKHLEITENNEYSINNEVFYDEVGEQYFIKYIVEDVAGNKTTKTQKIVFEVEPEV